MSVVETQHAAKTLMDHLPVLQVVIPLISAPLIVLLGNRKLAFAIAFAASATAFIIASLLLAQVTDGSVISYHIGGWAPPLGIEYRIDALSALVLMLISGIATVVLPYAYTSIKFEIPKRHHTLFYALYMLCLTGLLGMVATGDAFNVFVFLEISSLSTYVLVAMGAKKDARALTAAYDYLIMGTIGATFFVIGLGLLYMATGTLNMADLAGRIADQGANRTVQAAFTFIVVGMSLKAAMYPLHHWLPNAYTYAPSAVTTFLAATATKAAIYVLLRFMFSVFNPAFHFEDWTLYLIFIPFALLAMFAASFVAVFQTNLKRMLAFSSIAQIGYMLLGIAMLNATGLSASIVYLVNHGITKATLFMGTGAMVMYSGSAFFDNLNGLGRKMPLTGAAMVAGGLSLIGVPGTAGFISKWVLVQAAFENGWWIIAVLIMLSSLLAVIYVWRMFEVLYLTAPDEDCTATDPPLPILIPMLILAGACIWFGFDTELTLGSARVAADGLLAGSAGLIVE
ncbi:MAG: monovalent cation/H+ antiporter subunit D family protein [Amylibacter sp.]|nr:monovalent cation/H+ antiporter subunit D family protein [Amylibacter sp.]